MKNVLALVGFAVLVLVVGPVCGLIVTAAVPILVAWTLFASAEKGVDE